MTRTGARMPRIKRTRCCDGHAVWTAPGWRWPRTCRSISSQATTTPTQAISSHWIRRNFDDDRAEPCPCNTSQHGAATLRVSASPTSTFLASVHPGHLLVGLHRRQRQERRRFPSSGPVKIRCWPLSAPAPGHSRAAAAPAPCAMSAAATRASAPLQLTGDPWAEDPACYLSDNEIGVEASERLHVTPFRGKRHDPAHRFF